MGSTSTPLTRWARLRRGGARSWRASKRQRPPNEDHEESRIMRTFPSDLEIARQAKLKPLPEIADGMGIGEHLLEPYGDSVAKIKLEAIEELDDSPLAKYVVVSAITPTPLRSEERRVGKECR